MATPTLKIVIPDYAGQSYTSVSSMTGLTPSSVGSGSQNSTSSYLNLSYLNTVYGQKFVNGFLKYHMLNPKTIYTNGQSKTFNVSFDVYLGIINDPTSQGLSVPVLAKDQYTAKMNSYCADSNNYINGAYPSTSIYRSSFQFPPILNVFKQIIVFNWEIEKGLYPNIPSTSSVGLGVTMYGSKKPNEQWYFNASIENDGTIVTQKPINPKTIPSIVDGLPDDGNQNGNTLAGWNCLESWLSYLGYINQQIRFMIQNNEIKATVNGVTSIMTLDDINNNNYRYYQISSITSDGEGNGFENLVYLNQGAINPNSWNSQVTNIQTNTTLTQLWDKWINQKTTLDSNIIPGTYPWQSDGTLLTSNLTAAATRKYPLNNLTINIPCSINFTKAILLKGNNQSSNPNGYMDVSQIGTPGYTAQLLIFNEVYDTPAAPYSYLGANPVGNANPTVGSKYSYSGGQTFNANMQNNATSKDSSNQYNQDPSTYGGAFGYWDNLVLPKPSIQESIMLDSSLYSSGTKVIYDSNINTIPGGRTTFNEKNLVNSPLINNSLFNPWNTYAATGPQLSQEWIIQTKNSSYTGPSGQIIENDWSPLAWCLESSRYDLYNGLWAYNFKNNGVIDYNYVKQGMTGPSINVDGFEIWNDKSVGLKPYTAGIVKSIAAVDSSLNGQVYMLSAQAGPFVDNLGVRASIRTASPNYPIIPQSYELLTFSCPDSALDSQDTVWPGWKGMKGQWYGPGTSNNANIPVPYNFAQYNLGLYDPNTTWNNNYSVVVPGSGVTEDNFGVFSDFNIILAALYGMYSDLCGSGINTPNGIYTSAPLYNNGQLNTPNLGIYELGFLPLSWFDPSYTPTSMVNAPKPTIPSNRTITFNNTSSSNLDLYIIIYNDVKNHQSIYGSSKLTTINTKGKFTWTIPNTYNFQCDFFAIVAGNPPFFGATTVNLFLNQIYNQNPPPPPSITAPNQFTCQLIDTFNISVIPPCTTAQLSANKYGPYSTLVNLASADGYKAPYVNGYNVGIAIIPDTNAIPVNSSNPVQKVYCYNNPTPINSTTVVTYPKDTSYPKIQNIYSTGKLGVGVNYVINLASTVSPV